MTLNASALISFGALACYGILLLSVLGRDIRSSEHRFFSLYLLSMIIWSLGSFMIFAGFEIQDPLFWNRLMIVGSTAMPVAFYGFVQVYLGRAPRRLLYAGGLSYIVTLITNALGWVVTDANVSDGLLYNEYGFAFVLPSATWVVFIGHSALGLLHEYRKTKDVRYRNRIKYALVVIMVIFAGSLTNVTELRVYPVDIAFNVISALLIAYAILRHQLLDITVVVRKGLLYSIPTVIIGVGYFLLIFITTRLFHAFAGPQIFILSLAVAIITAVVAQPLRDKAQSWIDKLFFRDKYDSNLMLQRLSRTAAFLLNLDRLTRLILNEVCTTMHVAGAAFLLKQEQSGELVLTAQQGLEPDVRLTLRSDNPIVDWLSRHEYILTHDDMEVMPHFKALWGQEMEDLQKIGAALFIPVKAQGELVGIFAVGSKLSGETYSQDDQLILTTLANQTATAIEKARLYEAAQQELTQRKRAEEEIRRRAAHLEALNAIIAAAAAATDLRQLLEIALDHTVAAMRLAAGAIWLTSDWVREVMEEQQSPPSDQGSPGDLLVLRGLPKADGLISTHIARIRDMDLHGPIVEEGLVQTDVGAHTARTAIGCLLTVPILVEGQPIGGLTLFAPTTRRWSTEETSLVEGVGRQLGTAVERLRLFQEVRRHANELEAALTRSQELDRIKSEFIQTISHELRTPLALARGYAELLAAQELGELQPQQVEAARIIVRRVRFLSELVEDITLILGAEVRPLTGEPVALDELARAAVADFRVAANRAGLVVKSEIPPNMLPVRGESVYLRRVLDNLLENAVKFTPEGNTITVRVRQEGVRVVLQVSDTGIGIPASEHKNIFERFYQVDGSTRRRYAGVGLGLALVKQVVEALDGEVGVESDIGQGSTFTVTLPVAGEAIPTGSPVR